LVCLSAVAKDSLGLLDPAISLDAAGEVEDFVDPLDIRIREVSNLAKCSDTKVAEFALQDPADPINSRKVIAAQRRG
jgi:hypothetical protein